MENNPEPQNATVGVSGSPGSHPVDGHAAIGLEDRLAIGDLFARYMWALDMGETENLVSCFTDDALMDSPTAGWGGKYKGREQIRQWATKTADYYQRGGRMRHVISNLLIESDGKDGALARCYLLVYLTWEGRSRLVAPGHYNCRLRKENHAWRFTYRLVTMDHDYRLDGLG